MLRDGADCSGDLALRKNQTTEEESSRSKCERPDDDFTIAPRVVPFDATVPPALTARAAVSLCPCQNAPRERPVRLSECRSEPWARRSESDPPEGLMAGLRSRAAPLFAGRDAQGGPSTCHSSQGAGGRPLAAAGRQRVWNFAAYRPEVRGGSGADPEGGSAALTMLT